MLSETQKLVDETCSLSGSSTAPWGQDALCGPASQEPMVMMHLCSNVPAQTCFSHPVSRYLAVMQVNK